MIRDLSQKVIQITLAGNGLPWYAKGLEGQTINCGGCHHLGNRVRRYIARDIKIPNSEYFMIFDESHISEFHYERTNNG